MPRTVPEWFGLTPDTTPPPRVRLRVFDRFNGRCQCGCRRKIAAGEAWQCDHIVALVNGGENAESNLRPILTAHHTAELIARLNESADLCEFTTRAKLLREAAAALAKPRMTNNQDDWMSRALKLEAENAAQAQELERVAEQRDSALKTTEALKEREHEAHLERGNAVDREELASDNNDLLLGENAELRHRAEAAEARVRELDNPCRKIFDFPWLDPKCVGDGCQSLVLKAELAVGGAPAYMYMDWKRIAAAIRALVKEPTASSPELQKRPVAFRAPNGRGGWVVTADEREAADLAEADGGDYQGLYVRSSPVTKGAPP